MVIDPYLCIPHCSKLMHQMYLDKPFIAVCACHFILSKTRHFRIFALVYLWCDILCSSLDISSILHLLIFGATSYIVSHLHLTNWKETNGAKGDTVGRE